jgi:hypothetical protein
MWVPAENGDREFPVYIPVSGEPSPFPNGGIPHKESGIGAPLPSLPNHIFH